MSSLNVDPASPSSQMLDATLGAALLGLVFSAFLSGIALLQAYIYYRDYSKDWWLYRCSVLVLWLLDAFHLSLTIHAVYHYVVKQYGQFQKLDTVVWSFKAQISVNVVIIIGVQLLYAIRIWKLGQHFYKLLPYIVLACVAVGAAVGIVLAYKSAVIVNFSDLENMKVFREIFLRNASVIYTTFQWAVDASFALATAIDIMIALSMCYYLQLTKTASGFSGTNNKVVILMRLVLVSGLATSACSMACLLTFITMPDTLVFVSLEVLLTKFYVISFLAMLIARKRIADVTPITTTSSGPAATNNSNSRKSQSRVVRLDTAGTPVENEAGIGKSAYPLAELRSPTSPDGKWRHSDMSNSVPFGSIV
ncbi:hypothetical protein CYLTODRAFT_487257 [Cylindrobasidium torrendii FP15055 ss-10]|uniref:DUF6534 domain-containing protein n=1 Tax=Cylindrobasidium torrendii FP15055 ss-10 TaxID=1314674 RepID=A0A0D7BMG1_9AGAR|nr:hypothetical protein CYLTODRAFT_487257 [Cylindrobasidium torrendii FP15055 ss-10]